MMRLMSQNPQAGVETLIQLTRLGIPVTENSLFQMEAYKNLQHQMTQGLLEIADALPETLSQLASSGKAEEGIVLCREFLALLTGENGGEDVSAPGEVVPEKVLPDMDTQSVREGVAGAPETIFEKTLSLIHI